MRTAQALSLSVLLSGGGVAAQAPPSEPVITQPNWVKRPSAPQFAAVFPAEARRKGIDGRAAIGCSVTTEGTLDRCEVLSESPAGAGFGAAALALAPLFQMSPMLVNGVPQRGGTVRVPIVLQSGGPAMLSRSAPSTTGRAAYVTRPIWTAAATQADVAAAYPAALKASKQKGSAVLDCALAPTGRLAQCKVASEAPQRGGTGRAALSLISRFQLEPPRDDAGALVRGARVRLPVQFSPTVLVQGGEQIAQPDWGRLPEADQVANLFPAKAKAAGVLKGDVLLSCRVNAGGGLAGCAVDRETPAGMGFGEAALALAPSFTMSAWTSDGRPVDGARVRIPMRYEP